MAKKRNHLRTVLRGNICAVSIKISVYGLSSYIVTNVRVHSTSKNQCTYICGLPATYTLHIKRREMIRRAFRRVLRGAFKKRRWDICWFRIVEETIEVLGERDYCSIEGFDSCQNRTCTINYRKANIIIIHVSYPYFSGCCFWNILQRTYGRE